MTDTFDDMLNFDALGEAEKITGISYKDDESTRAFGFAMLIENNKRKQEELALRNDTHFKISFFDAVNIFEDHGFETVYSETFTDSKPWSSKKEDTFKIMWRDGILITCGSYYGGETLNSASMYYNWATDDENGSVWEVMSSGHVFKTDEDYGIAGNHDIREGFVHILAKLEDKGRFLNTWVENPSIWLSNYSERDNFKENTTRKMNLLPEEIQKAINVSLPNT